MHIPQQLRPSESFVESFHFLQKNKNKSPPDSSFKSFSNIQFQTKCLHLVSTAPLFGKGSMPVVDVIIQVTWPPH